MKCEENSSTAWQNLQEYQLFFHLEVTQTRHMNIILVSPLSACFLALFIVSDGPWFFLRVQKGWFGEFRQSLFRHFQSLFYTHTPFSFSSSPLLNPWELEIPFDFPDGPSIYSFAGLPFQLADFALIPIYLLARIALLVEAFLSLRNLPPGAYSVVSWTDYLPHIWIGLLIIIKLSMRSPILI